MVLLSLLATVGCKNDQGVVLIHEPPTAEITVPHDGDLLLADGRTVALEGLVTDLPDQAPTLAIVWAIDQNPIDSFPANVDGKVAATWSLVDVPLGLHDISLSVTDSDDNTAISKITVELVAPSAPPNVEITAPADGSTFDSGVPITFTGQATDANDPADLLSFDWTSSIDGLLTGASSGGGLTFLTTSGLSDGEHTIVLSATDSDGDVGTDSIVIDVGTPEDPPTEDPDPGEVIFSELMIDPDAVDDPIGEWVELYNTGGRWLNIGGYSFHDLDFDQFTLQGTIRVAPHDYVVLCANLDPHVNGGAQCDAWFDRQTSGGLALGNSSDEVVLTRPDGVEIDRLVYAGNWVGSGAAVGLDPDHMTAAENDDFANWCAQTTPMSGGDKGTPGVVNDQCP